MKYNWSTACCIVSFLFQAQSWGMIRANGDLEKDSVHSAEDSLTDSGRGASDEGGDGSRQRFIPPPPPPTRGSYWLQQHQQQLQRCRKSVNNASKSSCTVRFQGLKTTPEESDDGPDLDDDEEEIASPAANKSRTAFTSSSSPSSATTSGLSAVASGSLLKTRSLLRGGCRVGYGCRGNVQQQQQQRHQRPQHQQLECDPNDADDYCRHLLRPPEKPDDHEEHSKLADDADGEIPQNNQPLLGHRQPKDSVLLLASNPDVAPLVTSPRSFDVW